MGGLTEAQVREVAEAVGAPILDENRRLKATIELQGEVIKRLRFLCLHHGMPPDQNPITWLEGRLSAPAR
jgi:hypothetical protein